MRTLLALALIVVTAHAAPPAPGSVQVTPEIKAWIEGAQTPDGRGACCSLADGRRARIRQMDDGSYEVFFDSTVWPGGSDTWLPIPANAFLKELSPLGTAFVWIYHGSVRCAALPGLS